MENSIKNFHLVFLNTSLSSCWVERFSEDLKFFSKVGSQVSLALAETHNFSRDKSNPNPGNNQLLRKFNQFILIVFVGKSPIHNPSSPLFAQDVRIEEIVLLYYPNLLFGQEKMFRSGIQRT